MAVTEFGGGRVKFVGRPRKVTVVEDKRYVGRAPSRGSGSGRRMTPTPVPTPSPRPTTVEDKQREMRKALEESTRRRRQQERRMRAIEEPETEPVTLTTRPKPTPTPITIEPATVDILGGGTIPAGAKAIDPFQPFFGKFLHSPGEPMTVGKEGIDYTQRDVVEIQPESPFQPRRETVTDFQPHFEGEVPTFPKKTPKMKAEEARIFTATPLLFELETRGKKISEKLRTGVEKEFGVWREGTRETYQQEIVERAEDIQERIYSGDITYKAGVTELDKAAGDINIKFQSEAEKHYQTLSGKAEKEYDIQLKGITEERESIRGAAVAQQLAGEPLKFKPADVATEAGIIGGLIIVPEITAPLVMAKGGVTSLKGVKEANWGTAISGAVDIGVGAVAMKVRPAIREFQTLKGLGRVQPKTRGWITEPTSRGVSNLYLRSERAFQLRHYPKVKVEAFTRTEISDLGKTYFLDTGGWLRTKTPKFHTQYPKLKYGTTYKTDIKRIDSIGYTQGFIKPTRVEYIGGRPVDVPIGKLSPSVFRIRGRARTGMPEYREPVMKDIGVKPIGGTVGRYMDFTFSPQMRKFGGFIMEKGRTYFIKPLVDFKVSRARPVQYKEGLYTMMGELQPVWEKGKRWIPIYKIPRMEGMGEGVVKMFVGKGRKSPPMFFKDLYGEQVVPKPPPVVTAPVDVLEKGISKLIRGTTKKATTTLKTKTTELGVMKGVAILSPAVKLKDKRKLVTGVSYKYGQFQRQPSIPVSPKLRPPKTALSHPPLQPPAPSGFDFDIGLPLVPIIPPFLPPSDLDRVTEPIKPKKRKLGRFPSFAALQLDIRAPRPRRGEITGLVERPIIGKTQYITKPLYIRNGYKPLKI